jgi:hypothetical protein
MKTKSSNVMITREPADRLDVSRRATETDPTIATPDGILMTTKLRRILRDYGERVAFKNSLVLEILDAYIYKSKKLKKAEREIERLKTQLAANSSCK